MNNEEINPRVEFRKKNLAEWESFLEELFPNNIPETITWNNKAEIISVLNKIGIEPNLAHLFFPDGGGSDLTGASNSYEAGCIELHCDRVAYIVKPDSLIFESFGNKYEWAYFRLEVLDLEPSGVYNSNISHSEELVELSPKNYASRIVWDQGFIEYDENGDEISLPKTARLVFRILDGSFVIFAKGSFYNRTHESYDAMHNEMTSDEFKKKIYEMKEYVENK